MTMSCAVARETFLQVALLRLLPVAWHLQSHCDAQVVRDHRMGNVAAAAQIALAERATMSHRNDRFASSNRPPAPGRDREFEAAPGSCPSP